jgi:hypothetical protein
MATDIDFGLENDTYQEDNPEEDEFGLLGEAVWTARFINSLSDQAFAVIKPGGTKDSEGKTVPRSLRSLPHHGSSVKKGTENSSVDKVHLRAALSRVSQSNTDLTPAQRSSAKSHLTRHAKALGIGTDEIETLLAMSGDKTDPDIQVADQIESVESFIDAENLYYSLLDGQAPENLISTAQAKMQELASVGREQLEDQFDGIVERIEQGEDDLWHFTARVAQAEKTNQNGRLYPKEEFENNLPRVNRLCKAGRFTGADGHPGFFGGDGPSNTCVKYDAVSMSDNDLIMEGILVPTQAGQDITTLWKAGVQTEWSIIGYGDVEYVEPEGKGKGHARITNYVLMGCDCVRWGAASTRTLSIKKPKGEAVDGSELVPVADSVETPLPPPVEEIIMVDEIVQTPEAPAIQPTPPAAPVAPVVDMDAIKAEVREDAKTAAREIVDAANKQAALETAREAAIARVSEKAPDIAVLMTRQFENCETSEEIAERENEVIPLLAALKKPVSHGTVGYHGSNERARFILDGGGQVVDRPETIEEVKQALIAGVKDTGTDQFDNPRFITRKILENYEKNEPRYLWAMTRQGFAEAATTTTALGTTLPMVLPVITGVLPKLIPFELGAVMPIDRPAARVYFQTPTYASGTHSGSAIADSAAFDSDWSDHKESGAKAQVAFEWTYTDVTAVEKSVKFKWTSALQQDLSAIWGLDVEAVMLATATDYLALEINQSYLECMAAGAGISAPSFGTAIPATGYTQISDWLRIGLTSHVNQASMMIEKKMQVPAGWIVCGPTQAGLFEASHVYEKATPGLDNKFGIGLNRIGTWNNAYEIYVASWAETLTNMKNKMLIGYKPPEWSRAAGVYCPYIPMYYAPPTSYAETNEMARSVSTRNAWKVLQANGLALMSITSSAGTQVSYLD